VRPEALQGVVLAIAQERRLDRVLGLAADTLAAQSGVALARVWLIETDDAVGAQDSDQPPCLRLGASAGRSLHGHPWTRLDGDFARFPLGTSKIGRVGATGSGMLLHDMSERSAWIVHPAWAAGEQLRSFAAQPLSVRGETLGVLAVFSRSRIDADAFGWLRAFADHVAVAITNARAFEEVGRARAQLERQNEWLRADAKGTLGGGGVVGESAAIRKVLEQVDLVAASNATVLVVGETGTGKELIAHRVHERSGRAAGPLITVRCPAIPPELFERELFDHVPSAFPGSTDDRIGRVQAADGGTLFLDEIGEVPLDLQAMLLGILEKPALERVGRRRARRADVRVVATTNRDLAAEVAAGRFREDLFFRLSVFTIVVPPLRERPADVVPLVEHFLGEACARLGRPRFPLATRDLRALERYPWPGNVRELSAAVQRAVLSADGRPRVDFPPPPARKVVSVADWRRRERSNLEAALAATNGRIYGRGGAAELLGVPPTTLVSRLKALGIERPRR
jgi:transcriptional regulator with GAF, ATPase, and Fis domain